MTEVPKVGLYVTRADKQTLDDLPDGVTGAQILRLGLGMWKRQSEDCAHPRAVVVCPDCHHQELLASGGDEDRGETPPESDGDTRRRAGAKAQVSHA